FDGAIGATGDAIADNNAPDYIELPPTPFEAPATDEWDHETSTDELSSNNNSTNNATVDRDPSTGRASEDDSVTTVPSALIDVEQDSEQNLETRTNPSTVIFIDSRVPDQATLVAAAAQDALAVVINSDAGGVTQMAEAMAALSDVDSVHIIGFGDPGRLYLGSSTITAETISQPYAELFVQIGTHLSAGADILVYGCNFGVDTEEGSAAQALANATGADVASSIDLTGSERFGGDWDLERQIGKVETLAINPANWTGILDPISISVTGAPTVVASPGTATAALFPNIYGNAQSGVRLVPTTGTIVGTTALWNNAGFIGTQAIDLLATVVTADADDYIQFSSPTTPSATADDPTIIVGDSSPVGVNPDTDSRVEIRWQMFEAGTNIPVSGEFNVLITDIDGVNAPGTREAIAASINDPVSYTLSNTTNLVGSVQGTLLQADGTVPNTGGNEALNEQVWVRFNWVSSSEFTLTYILYANNGVTPNAGFTHDGDGDGTFTGGGTTVSIPKIDLDGSAAGNDFTTTYSEQNSPVSITDTDVAISNTGGTVTGATVVLTNRQAGDSLTAGTMPTGITATIDNSDPNVITVNLTGAASDAAYQTALQQIAFSNSSDTPDTTVRTVEVQIANSLTVGNLAITSINVIAINDAPIHGIPGPQFGGEDAPHEMSAFLSNPITVSDADASGANLTTTLSIPSGSLTLGSTTGVSVTG
ncbi:MAG: DUF4347 domain-containing protein, partial [Burkholderiaceae bacterium]